MFFGYTPRHPNDSFLSNEVCVDNKQKDLSTIRTIASENIKTQQLAQQKYYNKRRGATKIFGIGQYKSKQR